MQKCSVSLRNDYEHRGNLFPVSLSTSVPQNANFQTDAQEIYQNFNAICYNHTQRSVKRKKTKSRREAERNLIYLVFFSWTDRCNNIVQSKAETRGVDVVGKVNEGT